MPYTMDGGSVEAKALERAVTMEGIRGGGGVEVSGRIKCKKSTLVVIPRRIRT